MLGRRGLPDPRERVSEPERLRKGDANSGFPPPMSALRRLQRVGGVTRTSDSGVAVEEGKMGSGYGGWKVGEGSRRLAVTADVVLLWASGAPACNAVWTTVPCWRVGAFVGRKMAATFLCVEVEVATRMRLLILGSRS